MVTPTPLDSTTLAAARAQAGERRAEARLVTLAAERAERLGRVCADWPLERRLDLAFEAAFGRLRAEMAAADWDALRARYAAHRLAFDARLVTHAAGAGPA